MLNDEIKTVGEKAARAFTVKGGMTSSKTRERCEGHMKDHVSGSIRVFGIGKTGRRSSSVMTAEQELDRKEGVG